MGNFVIFAVHFAYIIYLFLHLVWHVHVIKFCIAHIIFVLQTLYWEDMSCLLLPVEGLARYLLEVQKHLLEQKTQLAIVRPLLEFQRIRVFKYRRQIFRISLAIFFRRWIFLIFLHRIKLLPERALGVEFVHAAIEQKHQYIQRRYYIVPSRKRLAHKSIFAAEKHVSFEMVKWVFIYFIVNMIGFVFFIAWDF